MVETWGELAPPFEALVASAVVWPAVLDVATHEQDLRRALGRPGARDSEVVGLGVERLVALMQPSVPVRVVCEDFEARAGPRTPSTQSCCCARHASRPSVGGWGGAAARRYRDSIGLGTPPR